MSELDERILNVNLAFSRGTAEISSVQDESTTHPK